MQCDEKKQPACDEIMKNESTQKQQQQQQQQLYHHLYNIISPSFQIGLTIGFERPSSYCTGRTGSRTA